MPKNVRNFWIKGKVDGVATSINVGPAAHNGGFELTVLMRHEGNIVTGVEMRGFINADGMIALSVTNADGSQSILETTNR